MNTSSRLSEPESNTVRRSPKSTPTASLVTFAVITAATLGPAGRSELALAEPPVRYDLVARKITVDGEAGDWTGVRENTVAGSDHLWFGQG